RLAAAKHRRSPDASAWSADGVQSRRLADEYAGLPAIRRHRFAQLRDLGTFADVVVAATAARLFRATARRFGLEGSLHRTGSSPHLDSPGYRRVDARADDDRAAGDERDAERGLPRPDDDRAPGPAAAAAAVERGRNPQRVGKK